MTEFNSKIAVNEERLWESLMEMGKVGALPGGGCCRLALSEEDKAGRDLFVLWCKEAGCDVSIDAIGNIYARRAGRNTALCAAATGSHLDTQPHGGKFDGIYGVLAGLEVVRTLNDHNAETDAPIDVIVWTNEEAARFSPPLTGSSVFSGKHRLEDIYACATTEGATVKDDLTSTGYLGGEAPGTRKFCCFIEAHIEQGPILENENLTIGVVTQIQGIRWLDVVINGQDSHAGTMPMAMRKDALVGAADMVGALNRLAGDIDDAMRITVGRFDVEPNSGATIPGRVNFNIDLRHPMEDCLNEVDDKIRLMISDIAARHNLSASISQIINVPPVIFDHEIVKNVREAAAKLELPHKDMLSGAGHDAMNIAQCTPSGMIFIPCRDGVSHNELEYASPSDAAAGANVLLWALLACSVHNG